MVPLMCVLLPHTNGSEVNIRLIACRHQIENIWQQIQYLTVRSASNSPLEES